MPGSELKRVRVRSKSGGKGRMKGFDSIPNLSDEDDNMGTKCIYCDEGDEGVLICGQSGCPVILHANCLGFQPKFDDSGNFCCPYCWYKYSIDICQRLKEKALTAKRDYLVNAHVNPVQDTMEQLMDQTQIEAQPPQFNEDEGKVLDSEQLVEEISTQSQHNQDEGAVQNSEKLVPEMETQTEAQSHENQDDGKVQDREEIMEETKTNTETEAQSSSLRQRSPGIKHSLQTLGRKRSLWTAEEENFLKEGVSKFSAEDQKFIPWKKILESGSHVFDKTRTPANLKDKWKSIISKEGRKN